MTIVSKTIAGLVSDEIATWSAQTGLSPVFSSGDPLLAFFQAISVQIDFLQAQIQAVLNLARAQTSTGADLDSWMAQFNFSRLSGTYATGSETFSVNTPSTTQIIIPVGALVQTVGGAIQYAVVADSDERSWSTAANGYVLPAGQTTITATVQAVVGGSGSNVLSNTLTQFGSSIPGIDSVTNPAPISNGIDAETDAAFRTRFVLYLATLAKATRAAILAAAMGVQQGLELSLLENVQPSGQPLLGSFTVVADDGSGDPPSSLLASVFNAVDLTRAFSVQPFVIGPSRINVSIALSIHLTPGTVAASTNNAVQNAVATVVNALPPGGVLYASAVITAALSVTGVASVNPASVLLNGSPNDLTPTTAQEVRTTFNQIAVQNY